MPTICSPIQHRCLSTRRPLSKGPPSSLHPAISNFILSASLRRRCDVSEQRSRRGVALVARQRRAAKIPRRIVCRARHSDAPANKSARTKRAPPAGRCGGGRAAGLEGPLPVGQPRFGCRRGNRWRTPAGPDHRDGGGGGRDGGDEVPVDGLTGERGGEVGRVESSSTLGEGKAGRGCDSGRSLCIQGCC